MAFSESTKQGAEVSELPKGLVRWLTYGVLLLAISLAIGQWAFNRSLWLDEAKLALNIMDKGFLELLQPLDREQAASVGFLWLEKLVTLLFGVSEPALRLLPLLSYLLCIPLVFSVGRKLLRNERLGLLASIAFALASSSLYYATEVKQYGFETMVGLALVWAYLKDFRTLKRRLWALSIAGCLAVLCSMTSWILLTVIGLHLFIKKCIQEKQWAYLMPMVFWTVTALSYYLLALNNHPNQAKLQEYWANYFMPSNPFSTEFFEFIHYSLKEELFGFVTGFGKLSFGWLFLSIAGAVALLRKNIRLLAMLSIGSFTLHLILSSLHLYPFADRLVLYLSPFFLMLCIKGIHIITQRFNQRNTLTGLMQLALVVSLLYPVLKRYPREREEIKPAIAILNQSVLEHEVVYLYSYSKPALEYYERLGEVDFAGNIVELSRDLAFERELITTRSECWFLGSHVQKQNGRSENEIVLDYFQEQGFRILEQNQFSGAFLYRLDKEMAP